MTNKQERTLARLQFAKSRRAERTLSAQLVKLGRNVGKLISKHVASGQQSDLRRLLSALDAYAAQIKPWAVSVARKMILDVAQRDAAAWRKASQRIGVALGKEVNKTPLGPAMQALLDEQVDLITSLPREAAERVQRLSVEALVAGKRASSVLDEILRTEQVTVNRARCIARTETARAAATITEVRARRIGSTGYIWRTMLDEDVRPKPTDPNYNKLNTLAMGSHRKLEGTVHSWDDPPIAGSRGERAHPGCIYNCRCYAEPIIPDNL